jgi:hypothetical protein
MMDDEPDDELENIESSMTATEFFRSLEECDSKRVIDFWKELDESVLEFLNTKGVDGR